MMDNSRESNDPIVMGMCIWGEFSFPFRYVVWGKG